MSPFTSLVTSNVEAPAKRAALLLRPTAWSESRIVRRRARVPKSEDWNALVTARRGRYVRDVLQANGRLRVVRTRTRSVTTVLALVTLFLTFATGTAPSYASSSPSRLSTALPVAPTVSAVSPNAGPLTGGTRVSISGVGLAGVTKVKFGGVLGTGITKTSDTNLTVLTPARSTAGTVSVVVISASGTSAATTGSKFTYVARPTISSVSPNTVTRNAETTVTITGTALLRTTAVKFGSTSAKSFTVVSDTQVKAVTPSVGWKGAVNATLTTPGGTATGTPVTFKDPYSVTGTFNLQAGESMTSPNGQYQLVMQTDGNLVLYRTGGSAIWATSTNGSGRWASMQADGNLVVYVGSTAIWSSNTAGWSGANLVVQDDGNLVIYSGGRAIWSKDSILYDRLSKDQRLNADQSLISPNRQYTLIMQGDGNLVLYKTGAGAQWATSTNGPGRWAVMQGDGNFVVYTGSTPVWASNTAGKTGAYLRVQDDGNLVIYQGSTPVWSRYGSTGLGAKLDAFVTKYNGKYIDYDGMYGAQCVDLFNFYNRDVMGAGFMSVSYAYQLYANFPLSWTVVLHEGRPRFARSEG